jgi:putative membrane protein
MGAGHGQMRRSTRHPRRPLSEIPDPFLRKELTVKLIIRWIISALSLFAAAWVVPGIRVDDSRGWVVYAVMAIILSLVNAFIRPLLKLLTCPLILLTLGLFTLVVNGLTLLLAAALANNVFNVGFYVDGFWPAFWGGIIVGVVSVILNALIADEDEEPRR